MAYATTNQPRLISDSLGTSGGARWLYVDGDAISTVIGADYFSDGDDLGMVVNDVLIHVDETLGQTHVCIVSAVTAGGAATVTERQVDPVLSLITTKTVGADESGTTFILNLAGGFVSTLPAPAAGLRYKFIVGTAPTTAYTVVTNSSANIIHGQISSAEDAAGSVSTAASADTISFVASKAIIGDYCEVVSDGTSWFVSGMCNVQDGMTTTQAS